MSPGKALAQKLTSTPLLYILPLSLLGMPYSCDLGCDEIVQVIDTFCSADRASYLKRHLRYLHEMLLRLRVEKKELYVKLRASEKLLEI